jgi:3-oxoacyl-[acyl-carrier protein] reductase
MPRLAGKHILVTGASRGIGRSVALAYAREGARVFAVGHRDQAALDEVLGELRAAGSDAAGGLFDVGDPAAVRALGTAIERALGTLDVVVNNAGIITPTKFLEMMPEQWERTLRVHLNGTFFVMQEMTRRFFVPQGRGKIINVSAQSAIRASTGLADYASAKGGILSLTRNAARELAPMNVQVNAVLPLARTRMTEALAVQRPADAERLRKLASADRVPGTFIFLASDDSDYVSGQTIGADGGATA